MEDLKLIQQVKVDRCIKPVDFGKVVSSQLHAFSDASCVGYGICVYIRVVDENGQIHVKLLMGKSCLAPLKMTTIPKLELVAAAVSVKITQNLIRELDADIDHVVYYTDSSTVLYYIHSEKSRFPVFVANRVNQIRDFTSPKQWKYVSTSENPADIASRGITARKIVSSDLWYNGPTFLRADEITWAQQPEQFSNIENLEDECIHVVSTKCNDGIESVRQLIHHYSSWHKLKKAVALYRRFIQFLQAKDTRKCSYSVTELEEAERVLVKFVQWQEFGDEMNILRNGEHPVASKSAIYKLDPFMDKNGVLRVGGRLRNSSLNYETKHPMLLPKKGHITDLVIRDQHNNLKHSGRSHVLSAVRERFWVINGNSAVRRVLHACFVCRKLWRPCLTQKMADLPPDRVNPSPPFSQVGVDLFGPYTIKEGRKSLKRYGVLFTCLTSRAVHIETVNSLSRFIHKCTQAIHE